MLESHEQQAGFIFDPRGRFIIADNLDTRWAIDEELPGSKDPDNESTVDFDDGFALVHVITQPITPPPPPGDDAPTSSFDEGPATSKLDDLYDMLNSVGGDSVRIYVGIGDESSGEEAPQEQGEQKGFEEIEAIDGFAGIPEADAADAAETLLIGPAQDSLVETDTEDTAPQPRLRRRHRTRVPSWDETLFDGPSSR